MSIPMISVVMSVYNDANYLCEAIESILEQSYSDFEFIIVDDGSTDNSCELIEKYQAIDKRIVLLKQNNMGLTKSLNRAIKVARGKYIARMDSDDISLRNRFKKQVDFLNSNSEYALVGTNIVKIDRDNNELEIGKLKYNYLDILRTFKKRNCIAHGSVMINKYLLGNKLHYNEDFLYAQDFQLWVSIAQQHKITNMDEVLYKLRIHGNSISQKKIEEQSMYSGIISYEFDTNRSLGKLENEVIFNRKLRKKIGIVLLMRSEQVLAIKYFHILSVYYWIALLMKYFNLKIFKNLIKKFI